MNSCEVTAYVTALANIITGCFSSDEIGLLAAILVQLGDTLATKLAFDDLCSKTTNSQEIL